MTATDKPTAQKLELLVADYFGIRQNLIVPNVSWGLPGLGHEADLLVIRSGWADEIEIKVSASDIKKDLAKNRGRGHVRSKLVRKVWFAVPAQLADDKNIPKWAGVLSAGYDSEKRRWHVYTARAPELNPEARKLTQDEISKVLRLSNLRVWSLKQKLLRVRKK